MNPRGETNGIPVARIVRTLRHPFPHEPRTGRFTVFLLSGAMILMLGFPFFLVLVLPSSPVRQATDEMGPETITGGITVVYYSDDNPDVRLTTTRYPSSSADAGTNCGGTDSGVWLNRNQAYADDEPDNDATSATAVPGKNLRFCDDWKGFGFTFGSSDVIQVVQVSVEWRVSLTTGISTLGTGLFTTNGPTSCSIDTDAAEPTTYTTRTYTKTACKAWVPADFNSDRIGVSMAAIRGNSNTATTFYLDYISVYVQYIPEPFELLLVSVLVIAFVGWRKRHAL